MSSSPSLLAPTPTTPTLPPTPNRVVSRSNSSSSIIACRSNQQVARQSRREFGASSSSLVAGILLSSSSLLLPVVPAAVAASDEEYVKETEDVINMVKNTIVMEKGDPNVASAVAELREVSNSWVAKYRREKSLLGRASFRDMYSALNAVSGHYISFGPTAPIPAKRRARILEEMETAQKNLVRGR